MKPQDPFYQNIGRALCSLGRFQKAHAWLHDAIKMLSESQNCGEVSVVSVLLSRNDSDRLMFLGRQPTNAETENTLRKALVIGRLHRRVLVSDCAWVIFKISQVLLTSTGRQFDADEMRDEAKFLVLQNWTRPGHFESARGEGGL